MLNVRLNADAAIDYSALNVAILSTKPGPNDYYSRKKTSTGAALAGF
jgi:hypothetical protein